MSYSFTKRTYSTQNVKTSSPSQAIEDNKKKTSLLKDNSWIRKDVVEDEQPNQDPNFGRVVLSRYKSNEALNSSKSADPKSPQTTGSSSYVQSLTKRFSTSQDELNKGSTLPPSYGRATSYSKSPSSVRSTEDPKITTVTKTTVNEEPKTSTTTTTTVIKNGTTTETTTTSGQSVVKTPTKTETFTERVFSDVKSPSKGSNFTPLSPAKPKVSETTEVIVTTSKTTDDKLFDTLLPSSIKTKTLTPESTTSVSKTETVTVKSSMESPNKESIKTTTITKTSDKTEDKLFDTLLPSSLKSGYTSPDSSTTTITKNIVVVDSTKGKTEESKTVTLPTSTTKTITSYSSHSSIDDLPSTRTTSYTISSDTPSTRTTSYTISSDAPSTRTTSYTISSDTPSTRTTSYSSKPSEEYTRTSTRRSYSSQPDSSSEYSTVTVPSVYTTTSYTDNSSKVDNLLSDSYTSKTIKTVYSTPERTVLERDLCSYCRKPMSSDPKMVLDDMNINCHATCFKCEVCSSTLGHLKAGDSMWIYRRTVHCERCFDVTREKWRR